MSLELKFPVSEFIILQDLWPDTPLPTDYSIMVSYHFIYGPPPSLWPLIVSESSLIGSILVAAKFEFIVTLGAVEILVQLRKSEGIFHFLVKKKIIKFYS